MGRSSTFYCQTCKVQYYLGYGSYGTWLDHCKTTKEIDNHPDKLVIEKNQKMRKALEYHEGHEFLTVSGDWSHEHHENGIHILCGEAGSYGACQEICSLDGFENKDLELETQKPQGKS